MGILEKDEKKFEETLKKTEETIAKVETYLNSPEYSEYFDDAKAFEERIDTVKGLIESYEGVVRNSRRILEMSGDLPVSGRENARDAYIGQLECYQIIMDKFHKSLVHEISNIKSYKA